MTTLHLGMEPVVYSSVGEKTDLDTADVAQFLENKYGVMQAFFDIHGQEIADKMAHGVEAALENLMSGVSANIDPFGQAMAEAEKMFVQYIDAEEIASTGVSGVPTTAALEGMTLRKKKKYKGARRPSFYLSGLYRNNFKMWVTE